MKEQNVNHKLTFNKAVVTELSETSLNEINGGSLSFIIKELLNTRVPVVV